MSAIHLTAENFDKAITSGQLVFVDFWATWCRPCMMMGPIVDELAAEYEGKAIIAKMNVDDDGAKDMKLFRNGVEVDNVVGAVPKATVKGVIDRNL